MSEFRKKPVVISAMQWSGPSDDESLGLFLGSWEWCHNSFGEPCIKTLESGGGYHIVSAGDWIIKGVKGEFYPCKPDIFALTYDPSDMPSPTDHADRCKAAAEEIQRMYRHSCCDPTPIEFDCPACVERDKRVSIIAKHFPPQPTADDVAKLVEVLTRISELDYKRAAVNCAAYAAVTMAKDALDHWSHGYKEEK